MSTTGKRRSRKKENSIPEQREPHEIITLVRHLRDHDKVLSMLEKNPDLVRELEPGFGGNSVLGLIVDAKEVEFLEKVLALGVFADAPDACGYTPLMYIARRRTQRRLAQAALRYEVVVGDRTIVIDTRETEAEKEYFANEAKDLRRLDIARMLIEAGADLNAIDQQCFCTPLMWAARASDALMAGLLIEKGSDPLMRAPYDAGRTAFHHAAGDANLGVLQLFLERGYNPDVTNARGETPLFETARSNRAECAELLLRAGANPNHPDQYNTTPLDECSWRKHVELYHLIRRYGGDPARGSKMYRGSNRAILHQWHTTEAHEAVEKNLPDKLTELIETGLDLTQLNEDGFAPIHLAIRSEHKMPLVLLLDAGVDVHLPDRDRGTPLHHAAFSGNHELVQLLIDRGADVHAKDEDGNTPLHTAAFSFKGDPVIELLLAHGADIDEPGEDGQTPLHVAAGSRLEAVQLLRKSGAAIDKRSGRGLSALHISAEGCHESIVRYLLLEGADPNEVDHEGKTSLHHVCESKDNFVRMSARIAVVQLLIEHHANPSLPDKHGFVPSDYAGLRSYKKIFNHLLQCELARAAMSTPQ